MKFSFYKQLALFCTISFLFPCLAESTKQHNSKKVKYVQGGACAPGKGTKKHPYASLAEAQADTSWEVLVVLSSTISLDGGIDLKSGQKLIGEENPTCGPLSPTQPIITNSSGAMNGGNGVVVHGNATIENIYFQNTWVSGINYDDAVDLTVKNVLVTGFNRNGGQDGGIFGQCNQSGTTHIEHVKIGQSFSRGLLDQTFNGAQRELFVCSSEFFDLAPGIITDAIGAQSTKHTTIRDCYIHDLRSGSFFGLGCAGFQGGQNSVLIENSVFYNVGGFESITGTSADPNSSLKISIDSTLFEEITQVFNRTAIILNTFDATVGELTVQNTVSLNRDKFVTSFEFTSTTGNTQRLKLCDNIVTGRVFYQPQGADNLAQPASESTAAIHNNIFNGTSAATGFATRITEAFISFPLLTFEITAHDNCFFSADPGSGFYNGANAPGAGTNATLTAHCNTISGFTIDIEDFNANVKYLVSKNWWGAAPTVCTTNAQCNQYQTCGYGRCLGPNVVLTQPGFPPGNIDASNPLVAPIICPHSCCPSKSSNQNLPLLEGKTSGELKVQTREEIEKYVETMKQSQGQRR